MFAVLPIWPVWLAAVAVGLYLILFKEDFDPRATVFWIAVLFALPVAGLFIYLYCGCTVGSRAVGRRKARREEGALQAEADESKPSDRRLAGLLSSYGADVYTSGNAADVHWSHRDGDDAFVEAVSGAVRYVYIETRRLVSGAAGRRLTEAICRKASEGVEVRILTSSLWFLRTRGLRRMRRAGAVHATFRPRIIAAFSLRTFDRDLREMTIVDGERALLGAGSFFEFTGRAASRMEARFLADWAHATHRPVEAASVPATASGDVGVQIVSAGPDCSGNALLHGYSEIISGARNSLLLGLPYMIPDDEMYTAIRSAALAGTDVTILLPMKGRHWYQKWNSLAAASPLADIGVRVYFSGKSMTRSVAVADRKVAAGGTGVFNSRATSLDYSLNAFVYSEEFSSLVADRFMGEVEEAFRITGDDYRRRSFGDRVRIAVSRMLMFLNRWRTVRSYAWYRLRILPTIAEETLTRNPYHGDVEWTERSVFLCLGRLSNGDRLLIGSGASDPSELPI